MGRLEAIVVDEESYRHAVTPKHLNFPGSIFYHPDFLSIAATILRLRFMPLLVFEDGELVGMVNLLVKDRKLTKTTSIPHLFQYYGPVFLPGRFTRFDYVAQKLIGLVDLAIFSLPPHHYQSLTMPGWRMVERVTYFLAPGTLEKMLGRCHRSVKSRVKKGLASGAEIKAGGDFYYDIYEQSFARHHTRPPLPRTLLERWVRVLVDSGLATNFVAYIAGQPVAFRTQLSFGGYAYDWLAGSLMQYNRLGINHCLVLKIGQWHHEHQVSSWDLLGGDLPTIGDFKRSFGATLVPHYQVEKCFSLRGKVYRLLMKARKKIGI